MQAGATHRVNTNLDAGFGDGFHVDHGTQVVDVVADVVEVFHQWAGIGFFGHDPFDAIEVVFQNLIGTLGYPTGDVGICRATFGGVVFDAAVFRWVVGRGDHNAIGQIIVVGIGVVGQNGVRNHRRWGVATAVLNAHANTVGNQYFHGGAKGGFRQCMGVFTQVQRAFDTCIGTVFGNGLTNSGNVVFVEGGFQGRTTVTRGAELDLLARVIQNFRLIAIVGCDQRRHVDQSVTWGGFTGIRVNCHVGFLVVPSNWLNAAGKRCRFQFLAGRNTKVSSRQIVSMIQQ